MTASALLRALWLGRVPYGEALGWQRSLADARADGRLADDCLLLLEHPPVYTMGRGGRVEHVPGGAARVRALGAEYVEVDRGGSVTFHGPGQLVGYPIVALAERLPVVPPDGGPPTGDVGAYLRALEAALCAVCAEAGVDARRRPPYTGAWIGERKLAAIGVKLAHGVTQHGVALNVTTDLDWFAHVVPCGIPAEEGGVTSLAACGVTGATPESLAPSLARHLAAALGASVGDGGPVDALIRSTRAAVLLG
jgi:lipoyl(octanoyl) transferase